MRAWTAANGRILLDVADILSHTPDGQPCYDNRDGVAYYASETLWENYPDDGVNYPAICPHYTTEVDGGHLGSVSAGKIRVAKAYWVLMAQLAGWQPNITVAPTTTPAPTEPVTATPTDLPTVAPTATSTIAPTATSTIAPTATPMPAPTDTPTAIPTDPPPLTPTLTPTDPPTPTPATVPTDPPTAVPPPIGLVARPNGVAVYPELGRVYATGRDANRVFALDGASLAMTDYAEVDTLPWGAVVNPAAGKLYIANFGEGTVTVLNAESLSLIQTIKVGPYPTFIQADSKRNKVFVVSYGHNALYVIDGATDRVEQAASTGGFGAWGVAYSPELNYVYVSNRDTHNISTLDGNNGYQVIASHDIQPCGANGSPHAMAFNPISGKLYVACAPEDTVTDAAIFRAGLDGLAPLAYVPIGEGGGDGGGGVAVNTATGNTFFTNSLDGTLSVISGVLDAVIATVATGDDPFGVGVDPLRRIVYVGNRAGNSVIAIEDKFTDPAPTPTVTPTLEPTPTLTPTLEPTPTATPTVEPTPTVETLTVHVGDLDGLALIATTTQWRARVSVLVHTNDHVIVPGARVSGVWGEATGIPVACTTNTAGFCTLAKNGLVLNTEPSISFTVTGVSYAGRVYSAAANHDPDGDSNGSRIVISQP
jgi:YVTN family beta-propeller protein